MHRAAKIKLQPRRRRMRYREHGCRPIRHAAEDADQSRSENPDQNRAANLARHQDHHERQTNQATCTSWSEKRPSPTNVAELATTSLALRSPTKAMNMPIPAAVEYFRQSGIPLTICSRMRVTVRIRKNTPEKKITPRAVCHGMCMPRQT